MTTPELRSRQIPNVINVTDFAKFRRSAWYPSFHCFGFQQINSIQAPLFPLTTPISPLFEPHIFSSMHINLKSKFLANQPPERACEYPRVQVLAWMGQRTHQNEQAGVPDESLELLGSMKTLQGLHALETWLKSESCQVAYLHGPAGSGKSRLIEKFADTLKTLGTQVYLIDAAHPKIFSTPPQLREILQAFIESKGIAKTPDDLIRSVQSERAVLIIDNLDSYVLGSSKLEARRLVKEIRDILPDRRGKISQFPGKRGKILTVLGKDGLDLVRSRAWSYGSPIAFLRVLTPQVGSIHPITEEARRRCGDLLPALSYLAVRCSFHSRDHWLRSRVIDLLGDEVSREHFPVPDLVELTQRIFEICAPAEAPVLRFPAWLDRNGLHTAILADALRTGNTKAWSIPQRVKPPMIEKLASLMEAAENSEKQEMERSLLQLLRDPMNRRSHHALRLAMEIHKMRPGGFVVRNANLAGLYFKGWRMSIPLPGADFSKANLGKVRFKSMDISRVNFSGSCLRDSWFTGCDVRNSIFDRSDFGKRAVIHKCDFTDCSWTGVKGMSVENSFVCGILPEAWSAARRDEATRFLAELTLLHASVDVWHCAFRGRYYPDDNLWLTWDLQGIKNPYSHRVDLWDSCDGKQLAAFDHGESISSADCAPLVHRLYTASEHLLLCWDLRSGEVSGFWRTEYRIQRIRTDGTIVVATCFAPRGGTVEIHLKFEDGKFEKIRLVETEMTDDIWNADSLGFNKDLEPEDGMKRRLLVLSEAEHAVLVERDGRWVVSRCSEGAFRHLCWAFLEDRARVQNVVWFDEGRYRFHTATNAEHPEDCGVTIAKVKPFRWNPCAVES